MLPHDPAGTSLLQTAKDILDMSARRDICSVQKNAFHTKKFVAVPHISSFVVKKEISISPVSTNLQSAWKPFGAGQGSSARGCA